MVGLFYLCDHLTCIVINGRMQAASLVNQHLPEEKRYARGAVDKVGYGLERFLFLKVRLSFVFCL